MWSGLQLNLIQVQEERCIWIGVAFLNHRIRAKVFIGEPFERLLQRLTFILGIEKEYVLGLVDKEELNKRLIKNRAEERKREEARSSQGQNDDDDESSDQEEGQIVVPKSVVQSTDRIIGEQFYHIVYIREKSEEQLIEEQQREADERNNEEEAEKSNRVSPRKHQIKRFQRQGIFINDCHTKAKKYRGEKRLLLCPFLNCEKEFTETGNLKTHLRTHTGERPYICGFEACSKHFITKGHLKTHELIHSGDKPFVCRMCNKSYSRSGRLKIHERTHTGEKPFECKHCGKTFTEKGNLKTHLRIHSGEKPFYCQMENCNKTFTTQGHLTDHMRRHSGERPFKCNRCSQAFMRSSTLKIHVRRHTGEKPYSCNECGKSFSESGNLKTHQKTHEPGKKKKCFNAMKRLSSMAINLHVKVEDQKVLENPTVINNSNIQFPYAATLIKRKKMTQNMLKKTKPLTADQNSKKKRNQKQMTKQVKVKAEISDFDESQDLDSNSVSLALDRQPSNNELSPSLQKQQIQPTQGLSSQNLQINLKPLNSVTIPAQISFGIQPQLGSPQPFQNFNLANSNPYGYPTSLAGYQQQNNMNNTGYHQHNTKAPSNKTSFNNLFASLQQNQNIAQINAQYANQISPSKGGSNFYYNQMSPVGANNQMDYGGGSFGGFSPEAKQIQGGIPQYQYMQHQNYSISTNATLTKPSKEAMEKLKGMGSFTSITSLNDRLQQSPQLQSSYNNYFPSFHQQQSGPTSKNNSSNNLLPLSILNLSKLQQQDRSFIKFESQANQDTGTFAGYNTQNPDAETIRQLQKTHSLSNLFTNQQAMQRNPQDNIIDYAAKNNNSFNNPQQQFNTMSNNPPPLQEDNFTSIYSKLKSEPNNFKN